MGMAKSGAVNVSVVFAICVTVPGVKLLAAQDSHLTTTPTYPLKVSNVPWHNGFVPEMVPPLIIVPWG